VGPWDGLSEIADHTVRRVRIDDLQKRACAGLLDRKLRIKGCRPAAEPDRVIVRLIDDVVCGLGESFLGVIGDDPTSKAGREDYQSADSLCKPPAAP
jgi:hypothetical protein